jgi:two-component system sensor histidine kinase UhpB
MSEELLQDVRTFARGLLPPLLEEVGLGPALRALIEGHIDPSQSVKTLDVPERLPRLPPPIELAVYRVIQEAVANVVRHSEASRLSVAARVEDGELAVWVIDNGRGFRPEQVADAEYRHLGLVSMRERAAFANGRLEVESSPGRGTRLCLRVPIEAPLPAGSAVES